RPAVDHSPSPQGRDVEDVFLTDCGLDMDASQKTDPWAGRSRSIRVCVAFLTTFKPTHPYVRVDIPRTPVESLRGCSSRTGRDRRRVRQMARRPSPRVGRRSSLSL